MTGEIPEQLEQVWSDSVREAFDLLEPRQQKFLLKYVECWNGAESYRHSYNENASTGVATASGSRLLANVNVQKVLTPFLETRTEDMLLVRETYVNAARDAIKPIYGKDSDGQPEKIEDLPDHDVRIKAAQALAKLHGMNAPEKHDVVVTDSIAQKLQEARDRAKQV